MKPRVAFFDLASCEGCQLQVANLEEDILDVVGSVDVVSFREVMKEDSGEYDIAFVEGSIQRPMDEVRLRDIRSRAATLIALGDCAVTGGVNKLRNEWSPAEASKEVYGGELEKNPYFDVLPARSLDEMVEVDFAIRGCPVRKEEILYYIRRFASMAPRKNLDVRFDITSRGISPDTRSVIEFDANKCILCRRCETVCGEVLGINAIGVANKGADSIISTPFNIGLDGNNCIHCGQCLASCPVGAFTEHSDMEEVRGILSDESNYVVLAIDPAAMTSCMEHLPANDGDLGPVLGKIISALGDMNVRRSSISHSTSTCQRRLWPVGFDRTEERRSHPGVPLLTATSRGSTRNT